MSNTDLSELLKIKGEPCISLIIPTHRLSPERRVDEPVLKKAIARAKELLKGSYSNEIAATLSARLDELLHSIDFMHSQEGLGLFVSHSIKEVVRFPFPVKEKIIVKESFELRELICLDNYASEYFLLELNEKSARLFKGSIEELHEIKDGNFPLKHENLYEYAKPTRGSSYVGNSFVKAFEKDKSIMEEIRMKEFLGEVDERLKKYLSQNAFLFVTGTEKNIALFKSISEHEKNIIDMISGNASYTDLHQLGMLTWLKMWAHVNNETLELIPTYEEKKGEGLGVEGIKDVWQAATAGRGLKLLVEKDFSAEGFVKEDTNSLHFEIPAPGHTVKHDVIDDIIKTVLDKGGDVAFFETGYLTRHQRIALITRY